jgi:hypothetical protein
MPDPRWMSVVIYQREQSARMGGEERPTYGDVDAEPLPVEPPREGISLSGGLVVRLRSVMRTRSRAEGALR